MDSININRDNKKIIINVFYCYKIYLMQYNTYVCWGNVMEICVYLFNTYIIIYKQAHCFGISRPYLELYFTIGLRATF